MDKPARIGGFALLILALAACAILAALTMNRIDARPRTDDAYLTADLVHMAPEVSGRIVALDVRDNQPVRRGQTLFVIDPEPYRYRVMQAQAQVDSLSAQIAIQTNQVSAETSSANARASAVASARAKLALAIATQNRLTPLAAQGFVTTQALDQARTDVRSAQADLQSTIQSARGARQAIRSTAPLEADLAAAQAKLLDAQRDLRLTTVRSPCDGQVTDLSIAAGEYASTGRPVFTLIDTEHWWAVGNFRETQLAMFRPGQHATVYALANRQVALDGVVDSLNAGVVPDEGTSANGLPKVPRSLNWVRIAQRFPVRILLKTPTPSLMRIGATATIVIAR